MTWLWMAGAFVAGAVSGGAVVLVLLVRRSEARSRQLVMLIEKLSVPRD